MRGSTPHRLAGVWPSLSKQSLKDVGRAVDRVDQHQPARSTAIRLPPAWPRLPAATAATVLADVVHVDTRHGFPSGPTRLVPHPHTAVQSPVSEDGASPSPSTAFLRLERCLGACGALCRQSHCLLRLRTSPRGATGERCR